MKSSNPFALWRWEKLFGEWQMFGEGFLRTIEIAALALILALVLGIIFGVFSTSNNKIMRGISRIYVEFFQNTPLVIQIFFMYNGLAIAGLRLSVFVIGVLGVGIYHGAYVSEVVKTGITSIPVGQVEAAKSQGFTYLQYMRYIILPQTIKIILPPLTNQSVNLIKNTSVLAMISGFDLMYVADSWASSSLDYGPSYVLAGLLYFMLCFPLATWARKYEERLKLNDIARIPFDKREVAVP
ncbi:amino acid ABC transporter permease [Acetobacterium sp.]|uniref:amino acid ABC transporter permease n=1 Tax=Acetobacterium sp. TaxID=1872094 RepID=UPI002F40E832